jgi:hypothetical protein
MRLTGNLNMGKPSNAQKHGKSPASVEFESAETETADLDFKGSFDPSALQAWCELIKDMVAMANSGGGVILVGVNDDGSPAVTDIEVVVAVDPAKIADKIKKYTDQHVAGFSLVKGSRRGQPVAVLSVAPVPIPIIFTAPGTYEVGGGKQKTAFAKGTVYFRHGAKSEPGTSADLRAAIERELDRIRGSWLDGIKKLVTAPAEDSGTCRFVLRPGCGEFVTLNTTPHQRLPLRNNTFRLENTR